MDTISCTMRVRVALLAATVSILFPATAQGRHAQRRCGQRRLRRCRRTPLCTIQAAINAASGRRI